MPHINIFFKKLFFRGFIKLCLDFRWGGCYNRPAPTKRTIAQSFLVQTSCSKFRGHPITYKCQTSKISVSTETSISFNFTSVGIWVELPSSGNIWKELLYFKFLGGVSILLFTHESTAALTISMADWYITNQSYKLWSWEMWKTICAKRRKGRI